MSSAGRDLLLVSTAAVLGGGLVTLAFTLGAPHSSCSGEDGSRGNSYEQGSWRRFLPRRFMLQSEHTNYSLRSSSSQLSKEGCDGLSPSEADTYQQARNVMAENVEVDGFEDVGTLLKTADLGFDIGDPTSTSSLASSRADKPDPYNPSKRHGYMSWDDYFMAIAFLSARRSKDPNRQVGACIVSQDRVILGIGYNGFPRGCSDDDLPWAKKSVSGDPLQTKYPYVCHAEVNAILNKNHASATGQRLYVTLFPCNECAKIIIQAGIAEVVFYTDKGAHIDNKAGGTEPAYIASRRLLSMAGIKVWKHQPAEKTLVLEFS